MVGYGRRVMDDVEDGVVGDLKADSMLQRYSVMMGYTIQTHALVNSKGV